jgi:hypothetical protein
VTRALAENINQEALPGDQVSGRSLVDKVRNQEGKRKIDNVNNITRYGGDNCFRRMLDLMEHGSRGLNRVNIFLC